MIGIILLNRKVDIRVNNRQHHRRYEPDTGDLDTLVTSKQEVVNASNENNQAQANIDALVNQEIKGNSVKKIRIIKF